MTYSDLDEIRKQYNALRELVIHNAGGWNDATSRERVQDLCERARAAIDDAECTQQLRNVEAYAVALYSEDGHSKWQRKSMSGGDYLRLQILIALEVLNTRVLMIDTLRNRAAAGVGQQPVA